MFIKKILPFIVIIALICVAGWYYKAYKTVPSLPAYENDLTDEGGHPVKISDFKGRYVLVSYFQTWCGSCIHELKSIDELQIAVGKEKLAVVMVSDEGMEKIMRFKEKHSTTLDYYQSNKPLNELSIRIFPTTYLLNKEGVVIMSKLDAFEWNGPEVVNLIK